MRGHAGAVCVCCGCKTAGERPEISHFTEWPEGKSPTEIGDRVATRFVPQPHFNDNRPTPPRRITYPEVCTWYGALTFASATNNTALRDQLIERFEPPFGEERHLVPVPDHVDYTVFAAIPLEIYIQTKQKKYLDMGQEMADRQWGEPFGPKCE